MKFSSLLAPFLLGTGVAVASKTPISPLAPPPVDTNCIKPSDTICANNIYDGIVSVGNQYIVTPMTQNPPGNGVDLFCHDVLTSDKKQVCSEIGFDRGVIYRDGNDPHNVTYSVGSGPYDGIICNAEQNTTTCFHVEGSDATALPSTTTPSATSSTSQTTGTPGSQHTSGASPSMGSPTLTAALVSSAAALFLAASSGKTNETPEAESMSSQVKVRCNDGNLHISQTPQQSQAITIGA